MSGKKSNKDVLKAFLQRKRINALGLIVITAVSALFTLLGALKGFARTDVLAVITVLLVILCLVQIVKNGRGFRTLRTAGGLHKKKRDPQADGSRP